jgi:hypothetical protein
MRRSPVLHPIFFALAPILFVYSYNSAKVPISPSELLLPCAVTLAVTGVLWLLLGLALRGARRSALIVSLLLVLFFLYGHVANALGPRRIQTWELLAVWLLVLAVGSWGAVRARGSLSGSTAFLNLASAVILVMNLAPLARHAPRITRNASRITPDTARVTRSPRDYPDIYYFILDAYGRSDVLRSRYGVDNSGFLRDLGELGFYVPSRAQSNYSQTYLSLASSLNFDYLDSLGVNEGSESESHAPLIRLIQQNRLVEFLRRHGYTIVSFASGYTGTDLKDADTHLAPRRALSEFQNLLLSTTLLPVVLDRLWHQSYAGLHREQVLYSVRNIPNAAGAKHPVFVWAHIVSPHLPFVFGTRGELPKTASYLGVDQTATTQAISKDEVRKWYVESYGPQVSYLSSLLENMVRQILARSPTSPVIILQGDHGPGSILNGDDPEREELPARMAILDAVHIPGGAPDFYDSITPVNTFRILLGRFFDTSMAPLPDRSFFSTEKRPFHLYDIKHPESYPGPAGSGEPGSKLSVLAFPVSDRAPANPALYCRRLVRLKFRGQRERVGSFYVHPVPGKLTVEQSFQLYRQLVAEGGVPDQGLEYESYDGRGPEQDTVVALFFRTPSRGKTTD